MGYTNHHGIYGAFHFKYVYGIISITRGAITLNIYLDLNNYYRVFDDQTQLRIRRESNAINKIFEFVDSGKYQLYGSFALENENNNNTCLKNKLHVQMIFSKWSMYTKFDMQIAEAARKIIEVTNAGTYDSLHLACAALNRCEYFITCDDRFIRTIKAKFDKLNEIVGTIKLVNPCDFVEKELKSND